MCWLRQANLGHRRDPHAPLQAAADHLVLGGLSDGHSFQQPAPAQAGGISALQLQRQLDLGSYKTAWLLCAKLRRSMVAPGRIALAGRVEVDETEIACRSKYDPLTGGGRSHQGKMLVVGAVEIEDGGAGPGRIRLAEVPDYSADSLHPFIAGNLAPGATAKTDGWSAYPGAPSVKHDPHVVGKMAAHIVLPWVHRISGIFPHPVGSHPTLRVGALIGAGLEATKMISRAERSAISRAVAKAIAYHNTGKQEQADRWVAELVRLLGAKGILSREAIDLQPDCWIEVRARGRSGGSRAAGRQCRDGTVLERSRGAPLGRAAGNAGGAQRRDAGDAARSGASRAWRAGARYRLRHRRHDPALRARGRPCWPCDWRRHLAPDARLAQKRIADAGVENVTLLLADAQIHAFPPAWFDLLTSRMGVMFFADPVAAFRNLIAALKPGGRLCTAVWATLAENVHWKIPLEIAIRHLGPPAPQPPHTPGPHAFGDRDYLRGILAAAGFADIAIKPRDFHIRGDTPAAMAEHVRMSVLCSV